MTDEIRIERAHSADGEAIQRLLLKQFAEHRIDTPGDHLAQAIEAALGDMRRGILLVAREGEDVIGVAYVSFTWTLEHAGQSAWLEELYVLPDHRDHGVGTALLQHVLEEAKVMGCAAVDLEVDQEHRRAERLYQRTGFKSLPRSRWVRSL